MNLKRYYRWKSLGLPPRMSIVLSFQAFAEPVKYLGQWYQASGKPVLWADGSHRRETIQDDSGKYLDGEYYLVDRKWFAETIENLLQNVGIVGANLCSGYIRNRYRRIGLIDEEEQPDRNARPRIFEPRGHIGGEAPRPRSISSAFVHPDYRQGGQECEVA